MLERGRPPRAFHLQDRCATSSDSAVLVISTLPVRSWASEGSQIELAVGCSAPCTYPTRSGWRSMRL